MGTTVRKPRESNFELLRIICMLLIMGLHYYNLGFIIPEGEPATFRHLFVRFIGFGGRVGVDMFVLISGYFMVTQKFKLRKAIQLVLQTGIIMEISAFVAFLMGNTGIISVPLAVLSVFTGEHWFITTYFLLYIFSDYINAALNAISREQHLTLCWLLLSVCSILPTFFGMRMVSSTLFLFVTLYVIAAYIRLYSPKILESKYCLAAGIGFHWLCFAASAIFLKLGETYPFFVQVSDRMSAATDFTVIISAILIFSGFKNLSIGCSPFINSVAASTLGVYLLHMNPYYQHFQWVDVLRTPEFYGSPWLVLHAPLSIGGLFVIYTLVDMLFRRFILEPLMRFVDRHLDSWRRCLKNQFRLISRGG